MVTGQIEPCIRCGKPVECQRELQEKTFISFSDVSRVTYGARPGPYSSLMIGKPHLAPLKETTIPVLKLSGCPLNKVLTKELRVSGR